MMSCSVDFDGMGDGMNGAMEDSRATALDELEDYTVGKRTLIMQPACLVDSSTRRTTPISHLVIAGPWSWRLARTFR